VLYSPEKTGNTLFTKQGTVEDKVLLAKEILKYHGIKSNIAFARSRFLPEEKIISDHHFNYILLNVNFKNGKSQWWDFSNENYNPGTVNSKITGEEALIIDSDRFFFLKIENTNENVKVSEFNIKIDSRGGGICSSKIKYSGTYRSIRKYFKDKRYNEDAVNSIMGDIVPSFSLDDFRVNDSSSDFEITASGESHGFAIVGSDKIILKPFLNKSPVLDYITNRERKHPLAVKYEINERENYRYILPGDFKEKSLNENISLKEEFGHLKIKIQKTGGSDNLIITKEIKIKPVLLDAKDYGRFLKFCMDLKKIDSKIVIIKK